MRKYLSGILGVTFAIALVSFTQSEPYINHPKSNFASQWFVHDGINPQNQAGSYELYTPTEENPEPPTCTATDLLCAIYVNDINSNSSLDQSELNTFMVSQDTDSDGSLDDESVTSELIKRP